MNNLFALKFEPLYQTRVWGGKGLHTSLGRDLPKDQRIGESWEIVDREEAQSVVADGCWKGLTLRQVLEQHAELLMGPGWSPERRFPILVKWLDCQERLSLQVHPPAEAAAQLGGEPKTEHWYVAETSGDAALIVGLKKGVSREEFESALKESRLEQCIHSFPTQPGDSILVESGRLHAIDAGNLILEIQQNSDTTYRVYDWGRVGLDGKPRDLHIEKSLQCIDFEDFEPEPLRIPEHPGKPTELVDCSEFSITHHVLQPGDTLSFPADQSLHLLHLISGTLTETQGGQTIHKGENLLLPYAAECTFTSIKESTLLITLPHWK